VRSDPGPAFFQAVVSVLLAGSRAPPFGRGDAPLLTSGELVAVLGAVRAAAGRLARGPGARRTLERHRRLGRARLYVPRRGRRGRGSRHGGAASPGGAWNFQPDRTQPAATPANRASHGPLQPEACSIEGFYRGLRHLSDHHAGEAAHHGLDPARHVDPAARPVDILQADADPLDPRRELTQAPAE